MNVKFFRSWMMSVLLAGSLMANAVGAEELFVEESSEMVFAAEESQDTTASEDTDIRMDAPEETVEEQILDMTEAGEEMNAEESLALLALAEEAETITSGPCGDSLYWSVEDTDGAPYLLIEGEGRMWDYSPTERPGWEAYDIEEVFFLGQITSIGAYAFYKEESLGFAVIEEGVESVGDYAFAECHSLWFTSMAESLKTIGEGAFENCNISLEQFLHENVTSIGNRAFAGNSGMSMISIEGKDTVIGTDAFLGCSADIIIYCDPASKAAQYAEENGIAHASSKIDINSCTVTLSEAAYVYDGTEKTPEITVKNGDTVLEKDKDYAFLYIGNVNAGNAAIDVIGLGRYEGVATVPFTISKASSLITASDKKATVNISGAQKLSLGAKLNRPGKLSYTSNKRKVTVNASGEVVIKKGFSGTAQITITAAETENYEAARKVVSIVVNKEANKITASGKTLVGDPKKAQTFMINAKAKGKVTFTYSSDNKNVTVDKTGKVTVKKNYTGVACITIKTSATKRYKEAQKTIKVTVNKKNNTITASNVTLPVSPSAAKTVALNAKALGNAKLTYSSDSKDITVDASGKITVKKGYVGKATITIKAAQTKVYNEATKKITVTVQKINNTISAADKSVFVNVSQNTVITLGAKAQGGAVLTYSSNQPDVKVDSKGSVTVTKGFAGTAIITITSSETGIYKATTKKVKIIVNKRENSIQAAGCTLKALDSDQTYSINASAKGGAKLTYTSNSPYVTVSSTGKVTIRKGFGGNAVITIVAAATSEYKEARKQIVIKVEKQTQLLTFKPTSLIKTAASLQTKSEVFEIIPLKYEGEITLKTKYTNYIQLYKVKDKEGKEHHMVMVKKGTPAGTYIVEIKAAETDVYAEAVKEFKIILS